jgi:translocation protein SEC62
VQALTSEAYRQTMKKEAVLSKMDASGLLKDMMKQGFFIRAARIENTKHFQPEVTKAWSDEAFYGWVYQGSQLTTIVGAVLLLVVSFCFVMYPLWPASMKGLVWYAFMALAGFIGFLVALSIIRLILFSVSMFSHPPGIWLFPNLFEDVGFFASFVPLWGWHRVASSKQQTNETDKEK